MRMRNFKDKSKMRKRLKLIIGALLALYFVLSIRLAYIMIVKKADYSGRAQEQWTSEVKIDARRGKILDRTGKELAVSANVYRVDFDLTSIRNFLARDLEKLSDSDKKKLTDLGIDITGKKELTTKDIAPCIAKALNMDENTVLDKLETKLPSGAQAGSATLVRRIEKDDADKVKALSITGIIVSPDTKRYYPNDNFLAHVLGSTNVDGQGLTGVELQYNSYLSGIPGMRITELDKQNNDLPYTISEFTSPVDGKDVTLTVDENIQYFAEKVAKQACDDNKAKAASVIVMDPKTGEVLAMATKPDFNPNAPYDGYQNFEGNTDSEKLQKMWRNRVVNDTFEPGSIFKVITAITALQENVVNDSTTFVCNGGLHFGSTYIKCWQPGGHGVQHFGDIIQNSCNVGFMQLGAMIGKEKLYEYINKFGFGKPTGIDLPGEASGIVRPLDKVSEINLATIAFGQTNTLNCMQYMAAFNAVANGGTWIQPHVMKEITHNDENGTNIVDETYKPITREVASKDKTSELRGYLERVVTGGSGAATFMEGYHIGGKTGTAQKVNPENGTYADGKYISTFVGMAPVSDPKVTVMVSVDEPSAGVYYASQVAVPYAKVLFTDLFNYLDSKFQDENDIQISRDVVIPEIRGMNINEAKKALKDAKLDFEIDGDGSSVVDMKPYPGYTVKEGAKINLYTTGDGSYNKNVVMPDVTGYSKDDASKLLKSLGLNPVFSGDGIVSGQDVSVGEVLTKGMTVNLSLSYEYKD